MPEGITLNLTPIKVDIVVDGFVDDWVVYKILFDGSNSFTNDKNDNIEENPYKALELSLISEYGWIFFQIVKTNKIIAGFLVKNFTASCNHILRNVRLLFQVGASILITVIQSKMSVKYF